MITPTKLIPKRYNSNSSEIFITATRQDHSLMTANVQQRSGGVNSVQFPSSADERDLEATSDVVVA